MQAGHVDLSIGSPQPRRSAAVGDADASIGRADSVEMRAPRNLDDEAGAFVIAPVDGTGHPDGNGVRSVVDRDFQIVGGLLAGAGFRAADVDGFLVPAGDFDPAVEGLKLQLSVGMEGITVVKIAVEA